MCMKFRSFVPLASSFSMRVYLFIAGHSAVLVLPTELLCSSVLILRWKTLFVCYINYITITLHNKIFLLKRMWNFSRKQLFIFISKSYPLLIIWFFNVISVLMYPASSVCGICKLFKNTGGYSDCFKWSMYDNRGYIFAYLPLYSKCIATGFAVCSHITSIISTIRLEFLNSESGIFVYMYNNINENILYINLPLFTGKYIYSLIRQWEEWTFF